MSSGLFGKQVLVLELETIAGLDLVSALEHAGASVVVAPSVQRAREIHQKRHIAVAVINVAACPEARALGRTFEETGVPVVLHDGVELTIVSTTEAIGKTARVSAVAAAVRSVLKGSEAPAKRRLEHGLLDSRLG